VRSAARNSASMSSKSSVVCVVAASSTRCLAFLLFFLPSLRKDQGDDLQHVIKGKAVLKCQRSRCAAPLPGRRCVYLL
jgi:hypothetical protein